MANILINGSFKLSTFFVHLTISFENRDYSRREMLYELTNFLFQTLALQ